MEGKLIKRGRETSSELPNKKLAQGCTAGRLQPTSSGTGSEEVVNTQTEGQPIHEQVQVEQCIEDNQFKNAIKQTTACNLSEGNMTGSVNNQQYISTSQQEEVENTDYNEDVDTTKNTDKYEEDDTDFQGEEEDQVSIALKRLIPHLANPQKFRKASKLMRQLMEGGKLSKRHGCLLFQGLSGSMECSESSNDPQLNLEYRKLFMTAAKLKYLFSSEQRRCLEAYSIWAVYRTDLSTTDDSFKFNKTICELKELIVNLPIVDQQEEEENKKSIWIQREALIDCGEAARCRHKFPWAKVTVELYIQHIHQNRNRFGKDLQDRIDDLWKFVRTSQVHGTTILNKRERTTFEEAQDRYAASNVSHRGKVGAQGDRKAENWLG